MSVKAAKQILIIIAPIVIKAVWELYQEWEAAKKAQIDQESKPKVP